MTALLELLSITKRFGARRALRDVSLSIPRGDAIALVGANGAGKTTLLRVIAGLVRPSGGEVLLEGKPVLADPDRLRRRLGHVSHQSMLHDALTPRENLAFAARLHGVASPNTRIDQVLRSLDLLHRADEPVRQLSRGLVQRAAVARALLHDPDILLMDEPYTGLDRASATALTSQLAAFRRKGRTLVVVTHDHDRALEIAERIVVLDGGRVSLDRSAAGLAVAELEELAGGAAAGAAP